MRASFRHLGLVGLLAAAQAAPVRVGFVIDANLRAFADAMRAGAAAAAEQLSTVGTPIRLEWREIPKPGDRAAEVKLLDELSREKVDALALDAIDRQVLRPPVEAAARAGIPIVTVDSGVDGDAVRAIVSTDNREAGRMAARELVRLIGGRGSVVLVRYQIHAAKTEQREEGFIEAVTREFPAVQLVASDYHAGATVDSATRVAATLLRRYAGHVDGIFASSVSGTLGMLAELRREHLAGGKIKLLGADDRDGAVASALATDDVQAYLVEDARAMGAAAVRRAVELRLGGRGAASTVTHFQLVRSGAVLESTLAPEVAARDLAAPFESPDCPIPQVLFAVPTGAPVAAHSFTIPNLGMPMLAVAPGSFVITPIDSDDGAAGAPTRVTLTQPYWLGKFEVTQREWTQLMGANPSDFCGDCLPVDNVDWSDATAFCARLTARERSAGRLPAGYAYALPTEMQWEFAARAGGPVVTERAALLESTWCVLNSGARQPASGVWRMSTHPVGAKPANAWGFCDLTGNVSEWCRDWFAPLAPGSLTDPTGPATGTYRVLRGGAWWTDVQNSRADTRHRVPPARHHNGLGFRVALAPAGGIAP